MSKLAKALTAAAGNAGESLYVEDVFSTYLYEGTGVAQTITNGIDLDGEGGLVWAKSRTGTRNHILSDTERGTGRVLFSNLTAAEDIDSTTITSYNSDGFSMGSSTLKMNTNGEDFASWTFRKAEKFFDVVTYTGDATAGRAVAHNLGSVPAVIIVKGLSGTYSSTNWAVYHKDLGTGSNGLYNLRLNTTDAKVDDGQFAATATDTEFTLQQYGGTNGASTTYVAYLFASDAGGFGDDGSESIIKCGSYTGNGSSDGPEIDLGFEPQWLLIKNADIVQNWYIIDNMRGMATNVADGDATLIPNTSGSENTGNIVSPMANGFKITASNSQYNGSGNNIIYIAIRRPMKTPESGTEVFSPNSYSGNSTADRTLVSSNSPVDLGIVKKFNGNGDWLWSDRLRGAGQTLYSNYTQAESVANPPVYITGFDLEDGMEVGSHLAVNASGNNYISYMFTRATGFFDVVAYTTPTQTNTTVYHNLGVTPELAIIKRRNNTGNWFVAIPNDGTLILNSNTTKSTTLRFTGANETQFTAETGGTYSIAETSADWIVYLFATLAGVSKVGSYTGTGADLNVDCGFSAGARFILIKRTDSSGDWYVWDSARGIVAGNDPYVLINSQAGEVTSTDYIDPLSSGFTVTSSAPAALNASGGTYIFLAIA